MEQEKTLKQSVEFRGRGLHTGHETEVVLKPAAAGTGIVFVRVDQPTPVRIPATAEHLFCGEGRQTSIGTKDVHIKTVEHLLASLNGLGVDNAEIEITGDEVPGSDGSAREIVGKILEVGLETQDKTRECLFVTEPIFLDEGGQSLVVLPNRGGLKLTYSLSYQHPDLNDQFFSSVVTPEVFERELAPARTFCLKEEATTLKAMGFGQGADHENTLVFENNEPVNNTLRFPNEACRHKVMDLLGDLALTGRPLRAHVIACRSGHAQNMKLVSTLREKVRFNPGAQMATPKKNPNELDLEQIKQILPHREPFLLVDRIIELVPGKRAVGVKKVQSDEYYFRGHFPGHPVMPGVLIVEALAQVGGVVLLCQTENQGKLAYFMTIDGVKFRKPVHPGDELTLETEMVRIRSKTGQCTGRALVKGQVVCEVDEIRFALVENK